MAKTARRSSSRLEIAPDVAAVLRPAEASRLQKLRDVERLCCATCGEWIEPTSSVRTSASVSLDGDTTAVVEFSHADCSPSRAELVPLVVLAESEPLGIAYSQALHPDAGAVLLWERKLDLRVRGLDGHECLLYLDEHLWDGFHPALADEPVRLLVGWLLQADGDDLVLCRDVREVERFHGAVERAPEGWLQSLKESGFCLLIVGAGLGLGHRAAAPIQRAIRERRALLGFAEFDLR